MVTRRHAIRDQLAAADPVRALDVDSVSADAVTALAQEIRMNAPYDVTVAPDPKAARTRRRRRRLVVALFTAGAIAVPAVAVAGYDGIPAAIFGSDDDPQPVREPDGKNPHSGVYGNEGENDTVPHEEYLYSDATGIVDVVRELTKEVPLPPGASWAPLLARYPRDERTFDQRTIYGQQVELYAVCAWYRDWLDGDAKVRARDQRTMDEMSSWKYTLRGGSGPGFLAYRLGQIADNARDGDAAPLTQWVAVNCR